MAAISLATLTHTGSATSRNTYTVRSGTAQANTGQTDWVRVPDWATHAYITLEVTTAGGNTPLTDFKLLTTDAVSLDDGFALNFANWDGITQIAGTTAGDITVMVGPGVTGIADDDTGPTYAINAMLPPVLGFMLTFDRTTGDEVYTYNLRVTFRGK